MPAAAPPLSPALAQTLRGLGQRLRDQRKRLGVSAAATAEAAGMSRVTLYRIEKGEPSVTMGAYLGAIAALGLELDLGEPGRTGDRSPAQPLPKSIRLAEFPQLARLAWQLRGRKTVSASEALDLYERNWRHVEQARLKPGERALLNALRAAFGKGRLLV